MSRNDYANGTFVGEYIRDETVPVGKGVDAIVQLGLFTGFWVFRNGETAMMSGVNVYDGRAKRSFHGQGIAVFPDGSTIVYTHSGSGLKRGPNPGQYSGKYDLKIVSGTGRMAGIKGSGKCTGRGTGNRLVAEATGKAS